MSYFDWPNFTTMEGLFAYGNSVTYDYFGMIILFIVWAVLFFYMKGHFTTERCMAGSSYIASIISVPMFILGLVPDYIIYFFIILSAIVTFLLIRGE